LDEPDRRRYQVVGEDVSCVLSPADEVPPSVVPVRGEDLPRLEPTIDFDSPSHAVDPGGPPKTGFEVEALASQESAGFH